MIKALRTHPLIRRLVYVFHVPAFCYIILVEYTTVLKFTAFLLFFYGRYFSCNPDSLVANAIELCTPTSEKQEKNKGNRGWRSMSAAGLARQRTKSMPNSEPFIPKRAMAVDLFPHTSHCEMVMLFER